MVRRQSRPCETARHRDHLVRDGRARSAEEQVAEVNMKRSLLFAAVLTAAGVIGCTSMTPQQQGTMSGAAIGAAAGAGIAAIAGGSGWTGAAVGAVAGGVAGNIRGSKQQK
ncbi:YMGG-like glycine zipper-containing protein [Pseudomonas sp. BN417]|uniref:YMGG-like glycine zipper-containing protein n=2 Tax=unclassified Pseudomonas TaxID=196821 RepID=UPI0024544167|nr:YMGG-like glycine zipper-containing protein [Pseudomonas sp. BN417]